MVKDYKYILFGIKKGIDGEEMEKLKQNVKSNIVLCLNNFRSSPFSSLHFC